MALLFLYNHILNKELQWLDGVVRAKRPQRLPVVLTRDEVRSVLGQLEGNHRLIATLLYGAGLRILECLRLRLKDADFGQSLIVVRDGKGRKDRSRLLPESAREDLARQVERVEALHRRDLARGAGWVELPLALARKYPHAGRETAWPRHAGWMSGWFNRGDMRRTGAGYSMRWQRGLGLRAGMGQEGTAGSSLEGLRVIRRAGAGVVSRAVERGCIDVVR